MQLFKIKRLIYKNIKLRAIILKFILICFIIFKKLKQVLLKTLIYFHCQLYQEMIHHFQHSHTAIQV